MTESKKSAEGFVKALDKFAFRLMIYFSIVLLVGLIAFIAELIVEPHSHVLLKHAMAEGFVTGLTVIAGLCLVELFLYWSRRYTRQLKAEARTAANTLTAICHSIPDLVYVKDAEGRHLMVNKAVEEFTGQNAEQLLGKSLADLLPPDLAAPCMKSDREPIVTGKPCRIEERMSNAGGLRILDTIRTPLRDDRGDIIGIVGVSRDITEKLKAEEERRLLQSIVDFGDTLVREVMTPRPDIVAVREDADVAAQADCHADRQRRDIDDDQRGRDRWHAC